MGGIYSEWTDKESGEILNTFSIVTTPANKLMAHIHNTKKRMPFILTKEKEKEWLNSSLSQNQITEMIKPFDDELLKAYTVSRLVSSLKDDSNIPDVQTPFEYKELNLINE